MSDDESVADDEEETALAGLLRAGYRTVTPGYGSRPNAEMNAVGWTYLVVVLLLFVPFLPLLVVVWLLSKVVAFLAGLPGED